MKSYTVVLKFDSQFADSPLAAAKMMVSVLEEDNLNELIFEVTDEETDETFDVDMDSETVSPH